MNRILFTGVVVAAGVAVAGAFYLGRTTAPPTVYAESAASAASAVERKVLYWHDPMVPGQRFDKPGKSPFMDMPLQPVYADDASAGGVQVSPQVQQSLGIRMATVRRTDVGSSFDAVGSVQFDERLSVAVQTRVAGYVERLAVRAPMERVVKGQALATVFAPDWLGPLNDIVALKRSGASPELLAAALERTRALSIPSELARRAAEGVVPNARFVLTAPVSGVVAELGVREGVMVTPGTTLFRIAGLEKVWAVVEVPEAQAVRLERGQKVTAALQADRAQTFAGEMKEILPQVNAATRTLQARFEVDNRRGKLVPGMLLRIELTGPKASRLVLPSEAVIRTGTRAIAIVRNADGSFAPRELKLGADLGDALEVVDGLAEGDQVVASGQFLVDSEARLRSVLGSTAAAPPASAPAAAVAPAVAAETYGAMGAVERVDADGISISHGPIEELKWPARTTPFGRSEAGAFADVKAGDRVHFQFRKGGASGYELVAVHRLGAAR